MAKMSEKVMSMISNIRAGLDELESEISMGEGEEMGEKMEMEEPPPLEAEPMEEAAPMPDEGLKMRKGMRPKSNATMEDYFSSKR